MAGSRRARRQRNVFFYLTEQEQAEVAESIRLEGVEAEIALLRFLIKKKRQGKSDDEGDKELRLHIETLCKALRLQHQLSSRSTDDSLQSLERVLDELRARAEAQP